jgi:formylglycine-generating enzyme required for sulfatase activity
MKIRLKAIPGLSRINGKSCSLSTLLKVIVLASFITPASLLNGCGDDNSANSPGGWQPIIIGDQVLVPAGEVILGDTPGGWGNYTVQNGQNPAYLDSFLMDRYEVTNQQYAVYLTQALDSGLIYYRQGNIFSNPAGDTMLIWIASPECHVHYIEALHEFSAETGYESMPVVMVSWYGAKAYAEFNSERLPTEQEWEKAARGTSQDLGTWDGVGVGYPYPWGNQAPDVYLANCNNWVGSSDPAESHPRGVSWFGAYNMAGNVREWTATTTGTTRMVRGGSFLSAPTDVRTAARAIVDAFMMDRAIGFRCAANF